VCFECVLSVFWVCFECVLSVFWVCFECVLSVFWLCFDCVLSVFWVLTLQKPLCSGCCFHWWVTHELFFFHTLFLLHLSRYRTVLYTKKAILRWSSPRQNTVSGRWNYVASMQIDVASSCLHSGLSCWVFGCRCTVGGNDPYITRCPHKLSSAIVYASCFASLLGLPRLELLLEVLLCTLLCTLLKWFFCFFVCWFVCFFKFPASVFVFLSLDFPASKVAAWNSLRTEKGFWLGVPAVYRPQFEKPTV
jgi:hypothetical protein